MFFFPSQKKNKRAGPASTYERSELVTWYVNSARALVLALSEF